MIVNLGTKYSSKNRGAGNYPTGRKLSLDIKFCYLANGKLAKFKLRLSLDLLKYLNDDS